MATVDKYKTIATWGAAVEKVEIEYDFANDAGATGALDLFKAEEACIIMDAVMIVKTTCTSGGSATVGAGKSADLAGVFAATAVASLTAGAVINMQARDASHVLAADDALQMHIGTAALTAGKIKFVFFILKA
jgi:hypothetical protein